MIKYLKEKFISHPPDGLLIDHLDLVADICRKMAEDQNFPLEVIEEYYQMGKYHDFAKITTFFQKYINKETVELIKKQHSLLSSIVYYWKTNDLKGMLSILYHHGSGKDIEELRIKLDSKETKDILECQIKDIKDNKDICEFIKQYYSINFDSFLQSYRNGFIEDLFYRLGEVEISSNDYIMIQHRASVLQTADKCSLIHKGYPEDSEINYLKEILKYKGELVSSNSLINMLREEAYKEAEKTIKSIDLTVNKILNITLPTGLGKTINVFNIANIIKREMIKKHNIKLKIIYATSVLSICDQNEDVIKKIMSVMKEYNSNQIPHNRCLSHHSLADMRYISEGEEESEGYNAQFCIDNFQSDIIITTFVKIFNTLFKALNKSNVHRFAALSNSILILDEVQSLPFKFHPFLKIVLEKLAELTNIHIIMVTATQPYITKSTPLIKDSKKYFEQLNRVRLYNRTKIPVTLNEFISKFEASLKYRSRKSHAMIVNTVSQSKEVYKRLKDKYEHVYCLNSEIIKLARLERIKDIKKLLNDKKIRVILITTQVIEAGVDIDFDIIFRDLCPFDSIIQACGRCNRNNKNKKVGRVFIYRIEDEDFPSYRNLIYGAPLIDLTLSLLGNKKVFQESDFMEICNKYFSELKNRISYSKSNELSGLLIDGNFKTLSSKANLIISELRQ